jgi:UDPglucose 6-dehydrogenase
MPCIGFAGLTHLGLCSAVAAASKGFRVVGFDGDVARVKAIQSGTLPVHEPDLDTLFVDAAPRLTWTHDAQGLKVCDLVYVSTDVPTDDHGQSDFAGVQALIAQVSPHLAPQAVLVVLCQVRPGFTRSLDIARDRLVYQVETLVFGQAMKRALEPERFILGLADPTKPLPTALSAFLAAFNCPLLPMGYESAELAKIAINCCLAASVSVANTLAELSEEVGADWSEIAPALRLDRRIGPYAYLSPGLGLAGGNIERDLHAVVDMGLEYGTETGVIGSFLANSRHRAGWVLRTLHDQVLSQGADPVIAILGLAYKEDTHSTKNAVSLTLAKALRPYQLRVFDPLVPGTALAHPRTYHATSALDAAKGADAVVVLTPAAIFKNLDVTALADAMKGDVVIDPLRVLNDALERGRLRRVSLGRGRRRPAHELMGAKNA